MRGAQGDDMLFVNEKVTSAYVHCLCFLNFTENLSTESNLTVALSIQASLFQDSVNVHRLIKEFIGSSLFCQLWST